MPLYSYQCKTCGSIVNANVSLDEDPTTCSDIALCDKEGAITKMLSTARIKRPGGKQQEKKVGELTKEKIEENREILEAEKERLSNQLMD